MWRDKRIDDCSREELLEIIRHLSAFWREQHSDGMMRARSLGMVEMLKRGERALSALS